jgi:hypothetical protein
VFIWTLPLNLNEDCAVHHCNATKPMASACKVPIGTQRGSSSGKGHDARDISGIQIKASTATAHHLKQL